MTPEEIFNNAAEMSDPAKQAAYLDQACGGDEKLRAEVEALPRWHTEAARDAGLSRESLCKALSGERIPTFDTILKLVSALGMKLHAKAM